MAIISGIILIVGIVVTALAIAYKYSESASDIRGENEHPSIAIPVGIGVSMTLVGMLLLTTITTVPAGHRGVVLMWGGQVEPKIFGEGLNFKAPFAESVVTVDVRVQAHEFTNIGAASKEMQDVFLTGKVNWHFDPMYVNSVYQNIGASSDFVNKVLDSALQDFVKEVTPQYSINVILTKRPDIRQGAINFLTSNLGRYHIIIDDIYLSNIDFSPEYKAAIEKQQVAERQVNTERNILDQKKIQAEQVKVAAEGEANAAIAAAEGQKQSVILAAQGEAESIKLRAAAQTDANKQLAESFTPELLKWTLYNKIGDKINVMIIPAGQEFILSPDALQPK